MIKRFVSDRLVENSSVFGQVYFPLTHVTIVGPLTHVTLVGYLI